MADQYATVAQLDALKIEVRVLQTTVSQLQQDVDGIKQTLVEMQRQIDRIPYIVTQAVTIAIQSHTAMNTPSTF
ncbi:hypothetical protein SeMB42_g03727 [Synchytrium endobioticum]|uniref:Uncharacterized protein n=1 Tax=Synchytrium endobioticum TaxID=286115 RepID=A0A507D4N6_9FUNG|nr:hypothetical protein SeMB42_g03727 [Synchytrium endobioticum]